jgi:hypothetical protein
MAFLSGVHSSYYRFTLDIVLKVLTPTPSDWSGELQSLAVAVEVEAVVEVVGVQSELLGKQGLLLEHTTFTRSCFAVHRPVNLRCADVSSFCSGSAYADGLLAWCCSRK